MYLLTEWEDRTGKYLAPCVMNEYQIFSRATRPNLVNRHFSFGN